MNDFAVSRGIRNHAVNICEDRKCCNELCDSECLTNCYDRLSCVIYLCSDAREKFFPDKRNREAFRRLQSHVINVIKSHLKDETYLVTPSEETKDKMKFDADLISKSFKIIGVVV